MFPQPVPSVDPTKVPADAVLLDVREPDEWQAGHIEGALHIPLADLPARVGELPREGHTVGDHAVPRLVVTICRSGVRSARAAGWLTQNGYDAVNLDGGMGAWVAAGREMVSDTGEAPTIR
jgi:rhodanese-related sulfurtransferase